MKIPFFNWSALYAEKASAFDAITSEVLGRGGFILQRDVEEFERKLAEYVGAKYAVGLADGTNAILLGLRASGVCPGDQILIPSHSFIAAAQSIVHVGATPIPIELSTHDWLIDTSKIEQAITEKTVAIMPVHVNGRLCQMETIMEIAQKYNLKVFEDSAQAMGAKYNQTSAGNFGEWGTFSFYPSKTLGCFGDAGALVTNSKEVYNLVKSMRNHGANEEKQIPLDIDHWGTNCRLDNLQAAILNYKLSYYDEAIARRREIAQTYHDCLCQYDGVSLPPAPSENKNHFDIFQNYEFTTTHRDELRNYLNQNGIGTIIQWGGFGLHQLRKLVPGYDLPVTDQFFEQSLLLPMNHILTDDEVQFICGSLQKFYEGKK